MLRTHNCGELREKDAGKKVVLCGFVHELRDLSKIKFILLRDQSGIIQVVALKDELSELKFKEISKILPESVLQVDGLVKKNKEVKKGFEVVVKDYKILTRAESLPIQVFEKDKSIQTDLSTRLDNRPIDLRKPEINAIFKIQSALIEGMQSVLSDKGFVQIFTPCIMGVASESGADVFEIDYYGKKAFLRQDPQLHRQLSILGGIEKLYDLGPNWRAELSHTTKHLSEHRVIAPEIAFINDEKDTMDLEEDVIIGGLNNIGRKCKDELGLLKVKINIPKKPFPELRFPEIYGILNKLGKKLHEDSDLDTESMKLLGDYVKKKYKADFYFVNRFPSKIKPFYVMHVDENDKYARSVDLNYGETELSSGGQREHRYNKLIEHINDKGLNPKSLEWFTKFFRFGAPPHGGFAIGIERLTKCILNLDNVKEAVLFPRDPERLIP